MLAILKLVQSLVRTLHSEGTPRQIGLGMALGAALGLTPLVNLHNAVIFGLLAVLNVSFGAGMLAWAICVPVGFLLDPVFDRVGRLLLLETPALTSFWAAAYNTPVAPLTNFNNTVVLGSVVGWVVLFVPIYLMAGVGVVRYRATLAPKVEGSRFFKAVKASRIYNAYRLFVPE